MSICSFKRLFDVYLLTIHLYQQLVESLLLFRVGKARHVGGTLFSYGVNLIDVHNAGRSCAGLFE